MSVLLEFGKRGGCRIEYTPGAETEYGPRDILRLVFHNEEFIVNNVYPKDMEPARHIDEVVKVMKEFVAFYEGDMARPKA